MHAPLRTCIGCKQVKPAAQLMRCRLDAHGRAVCGAPAARLAGRGAWVCAGSPTCVDTAASRGAFARAWKRTVEPSMLEDVRRVFGSPSAQLGELRGAGTSGVAASRKG